jgi:hypothetical protein
LRDRVSVFYYPDMTSDAATLKKAIVLFDEIHFIDRPSFMFGNFGTIGCASPLRQFEASFREHGVPLYVHSPQDGPVYGELLEQVRSDVNDLEFLERYKKGLRESQVFRDQQIAHGNYGEVGTHEDVARCLQEVNIQTDLSQFATPMELFSDNSVRPFDFKTPLGRAKSLISDAVVCSTKINFAVNVSQREGLTPLADATPYQDLLGAKYARAVGALQRTDQKVQLTDLSFAIFDELISTECLETLTFGDVIKYRKAAEDARDAFLEHLAAIHTKQAGIDESGDYTGAIRSIVIGDVLPAASEFKTRIDAIYDDLFGSIAKRALEVMGGGSAALQLFGHLSWPHLLSLAGLTGVAVGGAAVEALQARRAAQRECAISYILSLDSVNKIVSR